MPCAESSFPHHSIQGSMTERPLCSAPSQWKDIPSPFECHPAVPSGHRNLRPLAHQTQRAALSYLHFQSSEGPVSDKRRSQGTPKYPMLARNPSLSTWFLNCKPVILGMTGLYAQEGSGPAFWIKGCLSPATLDAAPSASVHFGYELGSQVLQLVWWEHWSAVRIPPKIRKVSSYISVTPRDQDSIFLTWILRSKIQPRKCSTKLPGLSAGAIRPGLSTGLESRGLNNSKALMVYFVLGLGFLSS